MKLAIVNNFVYLNYGGVVLNKTICFDNCADILHRTIINNTKNSDKDYIMANSLANRRVIDLKFPNAHTIFMFNCDVNFNTILLLSNNIPNIRQIYLLSQVEIPLLSRLNSNIQIHLSDHYYEKVGNTNSQTNIKLRDYKELNTILHNYKTECLNVQKLNYYH